MNDDPHKPETHPHELLAGYLDDTLSAGEWESAHAHLDACPACRAELQVARSALAALRSLPEVEAPGVTLPLEAASVPAHVLADSDPKAPDRTPSSAEGHAQSRTPTWQRVSWRAGLAAAAVVVGLFLFMGLARVGGGGAGVEQTAGGAGGGEAAPEAAAQFADRVPAPLRPRNYTEASLDRLAARWAAAAKASKPEELAGDESGEGPSPIPSLRPTNPGGRCLRRGADIPADATLIDSSPARFRGTRAYVGLFVREVPGGPPRVLLAAVSRPDCRLLYINRNRL